MRMPAGTRAAGVFTTNAVGSAPTDWCKAALAASRGQARGLLVNAGCANSFTGPAGDAACKRALTEAGAAIGVEPREMLAASTGVIGVVLDDAKITRELLNLNLAPVNWHDAARDHDDGHLPQRRGARLRDRRREGEHRRHREGLGHDRAEHGHDAGLRVHRRRALGPILKPCCARKPR